MSTSTHISAFIKIALALGILASIGITYQSKIVNEDFEVFTNPDGLPELDE